MSFFKIPILSVLVDFMKFSTVILKVIYNLLSNLQSFTIKNFTFLPTYFKRNELLWVDGFIIDFLQKKSIDIFLRKFVIYTGFIFSERLVFDYLVRFYLDNLIWPLHYVNVFEFNNIREILSIIVFFYFNIFSLLILLFISIF